MKVLFLGGTAFLGRHAAETALARGHEVTLFHRGVTGADLFPEAEHLLGDRTESLDALRGRRWDAVVDTSGLRPSVVRASAELLAGAAERYLYVSSQSVYLPGPAPVTEDAPVIRLRDESSEEVTPATFGGLKVRCEMAVQETFPGGALVVRPGLVAGPHDYIGRFSYWLLRAAEGGEVLAPGRPERPVQLIDARDLADWMVRLLEEGRTGTFNATGPESPVPLGEVLESCRQAAGSDARYSWVPDPFLFEAGLRPWMDLPLWVPEDPRTQGFYGVSVERARAAGLVYRPLGETARDTLAWHRAHPEAEPGERGIPREREREVLDAWHARA